MKKLILALALLLPSSGITQQQTPIIQQNLPVYCVNTKLLFEELSKKYQEVPFSAGSASGIIVITWVNSESRTFTITATGPDKEMSCIILSGDDFKEAQRKSEKKDKEPLKF